MKPSNRRKLQKLRERGEKTRTKRFLEKWYNEHKNHWDFRYSAK